MSKRAVISAIVISLAPLFSMAQDENPPASSPSFDSQDSSKDIGEFSLMGPASSQRSNMDYSGRTWGSYSTDIVSGDNIASPDSIVRPTSIAGPKSAKQSDSISAVREQATGKWHETQ